MNFRCQWSGDVDFFYRFPIKFEKHCRSCNLFLRWNPRLPFRFRVHKYRKQAFCYRINALRHQTSFDNGGTRKSSILSLYLLRENKKFSSCPSSFFVERKGAILRIQLLNASLSSSSFFSSNNETGFRSFLSSFFLALKCHQTSRNGFQFQWYVPVALGDTRTDVICIFFFAFRLCNEVDMSGPATRHR